MNNNSPYLGDSARTPAPDRNSGGKGYPTGDAFTAYCRQTEEQHVAAEAERDAARNIYTGSFDARQYQLCLLMKAEATRTEYTNIDYAVATFGQHGAELVGQTVDTIGKKYTDLLKAYDEAYKALFDHEKRMTEVEQAARNLEDCIHDQRNSEQRKIIDERLYQENKDFKDLIRQIVEAADAAHNLSDDANEAAVKLAGIQSYINVEGFKPWSVSLADRLKEFKTDVDNNIKKAAEEYKSAQDTFAGSLKDVSKSENQWDAAKIKLRSLRTTRDFACAPAFPADDKMQEQKDKLEKICQEVEETFIRQ
jgi:hypothetical protein